MKPVDTIPYSELVAEEEANLQKGMNFGIGKNYSLFLKSVRERRIATRSIPRLVASFGRDMMRGKGRPVYQGDRSTARHTDRKESGLRTASFSAPSLNIRVGCSRSHK